MYKNKFKIEVKTTIKESTIIAHKLKTFTDGEISIENGSTKKSIIFSIKTNIKYLSDCRTFLTNTKKQILGQLVVRLL